MQLSTATEAATGSNSLADDEAQQIKMKVTATVTVTGHCLKIVHHIKEKL